MKKLLILILIAPLMLLSCKQEKPAENEQMKRVIAIHDEVMPQMTKLTKLVGELKPLADSTETGAPYQKAMTDLQESHELMMSWMKGFGDRFTHEEILQGKELSPEKEIWLDEEEIKVKEMRDKVNESVANAEKLLSKPSE
ncbi:hypothetical protein [Robertkochia solimangrovi]|uniref:hypothetical protein n=1 Tax=Robertkochia solimangrovi TaxID=2213046 RepID=UPI00117C3D14|nr:hypothetical protein [Robertkochia solimangrovi]TRZ45802.1 hypothetical protein DMZ48_00550 [Robertkochia solimangrovi]